MPQERHIYGARRPLGDTKLTRAVAIKAIVGAYVREYPPPHMRVLRMAALMAVLCVSIPAAWAQQPAQPQPIDPALEQRQREDAFEIQQIRAREEQEAQQRMLTFVGIAVLVVGLGSFAWIASKRSKARGTAQPERAIQTPSPIQSVTENAANVLPTPAAQRSSVPNIFISYRREDSADIAGRISDRLIERFGKNAVFKDVDSIPIGRDFRRHLDEAIGRCDALVVIIGKQWSDASDEHGKRRLDDPRDHLRVEIELALKRDILVIPVLVRGASMPDEESLPQSLHSLAYRNGIPVRPDPDFNIDLDRLIRGIEAQHGSSSRL